MTDLEPQARRSNARLVMILLASLGLAIAFMPVGADAELNSMVTTQLQQVLCAAAGGTAEIHVERLGSGAIDHTKATCKGGVLDGLNCFNFDHLVDCHKPLARKASDKPIEYIGDVPPPTPVPTVQPAHDDGDSGNGPAVQRTEIAVVDGSIEVEGLPSLTVEDTTLTLINGCRVLGGIETTSVEFDERGTLNSSVVRCDGGLVDGFDCTRVWESFTCQWLRGAPEGRVQTDMTSVVLEHAIVPVGVSAAEPAAPRPTEPPPTIVETGPAPTPVPTAEPTAMPTAEPTIEPTVVPTEPVDPPTFPTPPTDDVVAPPGKVEDPAVEPTPTPVILL